MNRQAVAIAVLCMFDATECYLIYSMTPVQEAYLKKGSDVCDVCSEGYLACVVLGKSDPPRGCISPKLIREASLNVLDSSNCLMFASSYNTTYISCTFPKDIKIFILHQ